MTTTTIILMIFTGTSLGFVAGWCFALMMLEPIDNE